MMKVNCEPHFETSSVAEQEVNAKI